jgi:GT2 family glycosyltransferase
VQAGADVDAVIVAFGAEPWLERSVAAVLDSVGIRARVILVDNGCTNGAVGRLARDTRVSVIRPGRNLGFAAGCNVGVAAGDSPVIALVNPDAIVEPAALASLVDALGVEDVGIATGSIRLADDPSRLNSAGNEVHLLGLSWSGRFGEEADAVAVAGDVTAASGAGMAARRAVWECLGGFTPEYFAYMEDAELSIRCWQAGLRVVYVPSAVVVHRYHFSRNPAKLYLLERNRLIFVLTLFELRTLLLLLPPLLALEVAMSIVAVAQGWFGGKLRGWRWLAAHRSWLRQHRRDLQAVRRRSDPVLAPLFATSIDPQNLQVPRWTRPLDRVTAGYWRLVLWVLREGPIRWAGVRRPGRSRRLPPAGQAS